MSLKPAHHNPTPPAGAALIRNVQALRGVAALFVFAAHIKGAEGEYSAVGGLLPQWLYLGVTGVDLFFLISGFVMVHVAANITPGPRQSARFLVNRAGRIYPLYWLVTIGLIALYAVKKMLFGEDTPLGNIAASFLLAPSVHPPILVVGWTLIHEMYFYIVFAGIILAPAQLRFALLGVWALIVAAGYLAGAAALNVWTGVIFNPLTAQFLIGAGIAVLVRSGVTGLAAPVLGAGIVWLGVLVFGFTGLYPNAMTDFATRALVFTPPYALILYGAVALERRSGRIAPRWLITMGDASYALYLVHIPVFLVVGKTVSSLIPDGPLIDNLVLIAGYSLAGLAATFVAHLAFEKPMLRVTKAMSARLFGKKPSDPVRPERAW